ncbi:MAG: DUF3108 domain-containing protein [Planctomycetota bacterium]|nr:MAG: DUF3108 domain-containing protein [Planctomycetota bacterium]
MRTLAPVWPLALLCLGIGPLSAQDSPPKAAERWYEVLRHGKKVGYARVVWAPSTWRGRSTIRDETTIVRRTSRNMGGALDVFETTVEIELERALDGTLWWMRTATSEGDRVTRDELTWTGSGYDEVIQVGDDPPLRRTHPLERPVATDAEAFLCERARQGLLAAGQTLRYRVLDARARTARERTVRVLGRETVTGPGGPVDCLKVVERDAVSGEETTLWLDPTGAFVRLHASDALYRRVSAEAARALPVRPPAFDITTPSFPPLERIFSAERVLLDLHLQADPERPLPDFPDSPWSRVTARRGDDEHGWVYQIELRRYDDPTARARIPVREPRFRRDLEPTPLMPVDHPRLRAKAREIIGKETDARRAAYLLARWVHGHLVKQSPRVASTTALEILDEGLGDCSEHCVLFVALCRAAGIPARRVSGYVNIGTLWGAHDWAEVWVGAWMGADPTTGEVGTQARYLFFGYPDLPNSFPELVSRRASGRMRFVVRRLWERGGRSYDLSRADALRIHDPEHGRYAHLLCGIELEGVPSDWTVRLSGGSFASVEGPGFRATVSATADQGYDLTQFGGANGTFSGAPACLQASGARRTAWVHSRRRIVRVSFTGSEEEAWRALERALQPTFAPLLRPRTAAGSPAESGATPPR